MEHFCKRIFFLAPIFVYFLVPNADAQTIQQATTSVTDGYSINIELNSYWNPSSRYCSSDQDCDFCHYFPKKMYCKYWMKVCVDIITESGSLKNYDCYNLQNASSLPANNITHAVYFESEELYGTWFNPLQINAVGTYKGFQLTVNVTDDDGNAASQKNKTVDNFVVTVNKLRAINNKLVADSVHYSSDRSSCGCANQNTDFLFSYVVILPSGTEAPATSTLTPTTTTQTTTIPTTTTTTIPTTTIPCQHGGIRNVTHGICYCPTTYTGEYCQNFTPRNCFDIFNDPDSGTKTVGVYTIYLPDDSQNLISLTVYCKNGWTEVQQRYNGLISFAQNFAAYETGFGTVDESGNFNYWMGNEYFHYLTSNQDQMSVRFNFKFCGGTTLVSSLYKNITIGNRNTNYTFYANDFTDFGGGDGVQWFNGSPFTVAEKSDGVANCAFFYDKSGFWFNNIFCTNDAFNVPNLNGNYLDNSSCNTPFPNYGILWSPLTTLPDGTFQSLTFSEIQIAPAATVDLLLAYENELKKLETINL